MKRWVLKCKRCGDGAYYTHEYPQPGSIPMSKDWFSCKDGEHPVPGTYPRCPYCNAPLSIDYKYLEVQNE